MTPQQYAHLTELFHAALKIDPDQRAAFLDQLSDDDAELRPELESLLADHEQRVAQKEKAPDDITAALYQAQQDAGGGKVNSLAPNTRPDRYEIRSLLGKGGMGEVYLAEDMRLHREVALKILPAAIADNQDRMRRFEQEAQAAAALSHPHIAQIFEIGESDGINYIAMELLEGVTLRAKIHKERSELPRLLKYLQQVAEGLAKAHTAGIVHRDLKPDNIMITRDGYAKILDFGLAKLIEPERPIGSGSEALSEVDTAMMGPQSSIGMVMGTAGYMSPEQALGKVNEIDQRSDIFSFGCVLFEAVTRQKPFADESFIKLLHKVAYESAPPLNDFTPAAPPDLQRIVRRCLAKDPDERYQTIKDVALELKEVRQGMAGPSGTATQTSRSIAVLPFFDMSPARDHDWFCEGIAEEILNALARLPNLRAATRTSAFRFRDPARDLRAIGETLGVKTLLEGSVRTAGSRLRVTAQLVNASDGLQLWSERFDRQMEDVFEIQDEIASKVVDALELRLAPMPAVPWIRHSDDLEAYQLFLKGRHFRYTYQKFDLNRAQQYFEAAINRDPGYALARIALAETLVFRTIYGLIPPSTSQTRAREELRKAREIAGESAQARGVEALLAFLFDWDTRTALKGFERALELDPTSIPSRAFYSWALFVGGRSADAVEQARRVVSLDPQSPYANAMAAVTLLMADRLEEAIMFGRRAVEMAPDSLLGTWILGLALGGSSAWEEANEWLSRAVDRSSRAPFYLGLLGWCQGASGSHEEARQTLSELERRASTEYVSPVFLAGALSELGDSEEARKRLGEAFAERSPLLVLLEFPHVRQLRADPLMQNLRQQLLEGGAVTESKD